MHRWLAILLLALLPLQFSWAAVAAYCGHEPGQQSEHLGHHEHEHQHAQATPHDGVASEEGPSGPSGFDVDCGHCHASFVSVPVMAPGLVIPLPGRPCPHAGADSLRERPATPPERPQWRLLA